MEGIAKLLPAALRQHLLRSNASMVEVLNSLWVSMVGRGIARQCRPVDFSASTLTIVTSCPNWAVQFRQLNDEIRRNINKVLGGEMVKKMRVRLDPSFQPPELPESAASTGQLKRPRIKVTQGKAKDGGDALGIIRQSYEKYFARNKREPD